MFLVYGVHLKQEILRMRYWEDMTLEEVAEKFELSRERIRQIEKEALEKLRKVLLRKGIAPDDYAV